MSCLQPKNRCWPGFLPFVQVLPGFRGLHADVLIGLTAFGAYMQSFSHEHYVPRLIPNLTSNQRVRVRVYEAGSMERGWGGDTKGAKGEVAKKRGEKGG